ncbi:hypothetical protein [Methylobacterium indicum]|nr:hypothetical protein [Methylobacterium indicum]
MYDLKQTLDSCIFDEYSIKDTLQELHEKNSISIDRAKEYFIEAYKNGFFDLYKDGESGGEHVFLSVDLEDINLDLDNIKMIYLAQKTD